MNKKTIMIVVATAVIVIMFSSKIEALPLVNKIPKF